jgi:penicillin-binding protein 1C
MHVRPVDRRAGRGGAGGDSPLIPRRIKRWVKRLAGAWLLLLLVGAVALAVVWRACPFPVERLDRWPASPVVTDVHGRPLLVRPSAEDQWRLPVPLERMSPWLIDATIATEDQRFRSHGGVDAIAVLRAAGQNLAAWRTVSGASTITMQVCRMMEPRDRTLGAKCVEALRAMQLERLRSKEDILAIYLNVAPYGGNVRGVEAAALTYFGKHAADLSLGESALLAGLPQSPARLRPDRHGEAAKRRRRTVLRRMAERNMITEQQRRQAEQEPVVICRRWRPRGAPHAAFLALRRRPHGGRTTIDLGVQAEVERLAERHLANLPDGTETAVVVLDIETSAITAILGSGDVADPLDGQVNGAVARRSPGSALKPFIYAAAFEAGRLGGDSIVYDVPIRRGGWSPENFDRTFRGKLAARDALRQSLNVPAILVAEGVGLTRCIGVIRAVGIDLPRDARRRGGLALAVGGIEVSLLDLVNGYATLGRGGVRRRPRLLADEPTEESLALSAGTCAAVNDILSSRRRRPRGMELAEPTQVPWFMWKTGTSAGRRDAWAVGHNGRHAIGVWVGRFRGTGRVAYVGAEAAEPLLASLFALPALRVDRDPPPPAPIVVRRPLPPPEAAADALRVVCPGDGETYCAVADRAVVHIRANREGGLRWFLNGRLLDDGSAGRLVLPPGGYELRCIDAAGASSAVRFAVR